MANLDIVLIAIVVVAVASVVAWAIARMGKDEPEGQPIVKAPGDPCEFVTGQGGDWPTWEWPERNPVDVMQEVQERYPELQASERQLRDWVELAQRVRRHN